MPFPKGGHHSEATKDKIREKMQARIGEKNPFFGKKHSEEWKAKMRNRPNPMLGRHHSEATKAKIRSVALERSSHYRHTEETKAKLREMRLGDKNPMWKGDNATAKSGRDRARSLYKCPNDSERHHVNGNPLNNSQDNVKIVTRKQHMEVDGRLQSRDSYGRFKRS